MTVTSRRVLSQQDAHFLHGERPLEALVRPPVEAPAALAWVTRKEVLLVASREGSLFAVEPSFGTQPLPGTVRDPVAILASPDRVAVLGAAGALEVRAAPGSEPAWRAETGLGGDAALVWWRGGVAAIGDDGHERRVIVYADDGTVRVRARVPGKCALGVTGDGHLVLGRSTVTGLAAAPFGRPFPDGEPTEHAIRFGADLAAVGVAVGGVAVWSAPGAAPVTVKMFDVCRAALSADGEWLAMGTRRGRVAIADARVGSALRANPARVVGHEGAVTALEFASRGRWLASAAETCIVWGF